MNFRLAYIFSLLLLFGSLRAQELASLGFNVICCDSLAESLKARVRETAAIALNFEYIDFWEKKGGEKRGATRIAGGHVSITISIGVAERSEDSTDAGSVIRLADKNLYKAKRAGRNRVVG